MTMMTRTQIEKAYRCRAACIASYITPGECFIQVASETSGIRGRCGTI